MATQALLAELNRVAGYIIRTKDHNFNHGTSITDGKIQAIKDLRSITGLGLKEAKDVIDGAWKVTSVSSTALAGWLAAKLETEYGVTSTIGDQTAFHTNVMHTGDQIMFSPKYNSPGMGDGSYIYNQQPVDLTPLLTVLQAIHAEVHEQTQLLKDLLEAME